MVAETDRRTRLTDAAAPCTLLRPPRDQDALALHAVIGDPEVCRFLPLSPSDSIAMTRHYLGLCATAAAQGVAKSWVVALAGQPDIALGLIQAGWAQGRVELGFLLARAQWGQGLMADALGQLLDSAPYRGSQATAACDAGNLAARRMLAKPGFTVRQTLLAHRVHPALGPAPRDCLLLLRDGADDRPGRGAAFPITRPTMNARTSA